MNVTETQNGQLRRSLVRVVRACSFEREQERDEIPPARPQVWENATEMLDAQFDGLGQQRSDRRLLRLC